MTQADQPTSVPANAPADVSAGVAPSAVPVAADGTNWQKLWQYTKGIAHDDELFIQSTAIKGGGVVAVMIGGLYMIPAAAGLPWVLAAGAVGAGAVMIGVGAAGVVMGAGALVNSVKRIIRDVDHAALNPEKKLTLDEARQGLQNKFRESGAVKALRSWRVSQAIGRTRVWKMTMKNWNRAQSFISDNGVFIKSFAVAGSAANIAAGVMMLASGTVLFPLILGGAATIATVGVAVGSIGWGLAAGYVLVKNIVKGTQPSQKAPRPLKVRALNRKERRALKAKTQAAADNISAPLSPDPASSSPRGAAASFKEAVAPSVPAETAPVQAVPASAVKSAPSAP